MACTRASDQPQATTGSYGSGVSLEGLDAGEVPTVAPSTPDGGTAGGGAAGNEQGPDGSGGGGGQAPRRPVVAVAADAGPVGANALAYLRDAHRKLVVEVTAVEGKGPRPEAIDLLKTRLGEVLSKPDGIEIRGAQTIPASNTEYSIKEIAELEDRYRKVRSDREGPVASVHVLYINGRIRNDAPNVETLGAAYRASSIVMAPDTIERASNPVLSADKIERAVLVHEFGHVLGLVNIGYRSPRDHEDPEHPGHSKNRASVMYWAVNSFDVANILAGDLPTTFDADDKADLADRKAGKI